MNINDISYRVVLNESNKDFQCEPEYDFCKTEVDFISENPFKARKQALDYINYIRQSMSLSKHAFIQLFIVKKDEQGKEEDIVLSTGYNEPSQVKVKEDNLKWEKEMYRSFRYTHPLPSPIW